MLLEWLQATNLSPTIAEALKNPGYRLATTTAESIQSRTDAWDPRQRCGGQLRPRGAAGGGPEGTGQPDRAGRVKEQVGPLPGGHADGQGSGRPWHESGTVQSAHDLHQSAGHRKTTIARVVANILAGLGVIAEPKLIETSRKDFCRGNTRASPRSRPPRPSTVPGGAIHRSRPIRWFRNATGVPTHSAWRRWTPCWPAWRTTGTNLQVIIACETVE